MKRKWSILALGAAAAVGALFIPVGGGAVLAPASGEKLEMDLSAYAADAPKDGLNMLFIHHSCGGQLLADPGAEDEVADCVLKAHPNGGGMRRALEKVGYTVNEASYGSIVGEDTDIFHWRPKFTDQLDRILKTKLNDELLADSEQNDIVVFKSCYPNNRFVAEGEAPGKPEGPDLTVWNAKATMAALLDSFAKHPDTLFVYLTAPANAPVAESDPAWKWLVKSVLGKPTNAEVKAERAALARDFNRWMVSPDGWLAGYEGKNVAVFDYYDVLTGNGESNLLKYPTGDGSDSHPSSEGNAKASEAFVPFLNKVVNRHRATAEPIAAEPGATTDS